jgi:RNA-directed DNA polymerase
VSFAPAVSNDAATKMRRTMRSWRLHSRSGTAIEDLARMYNPVFRGWIRYYGKFHKSALNVVFRHLDRTLARWAMWKFKRLRGHRRSAEHWLGRLARREPRLFAHWELLGLKPAIG